MEDGRCKLGLAGRLELVRLVESGATFRAAAAAMNVAPATAHRWWHRWQQASEPERNSRACLRALPPVPRTCPWRLQEAAEQRIWMRGRGRTWGRHGWPGWSAIAVRRFGRSCVATAGSRRRRTPPERYSRRYEWSEPGALLHIDTKQLPVFAQPGHWAHGDRSRITKNRGPARVQFAHVVVDHHTRLAYVEIHAYDRGEIAGQVPRCAATWMAENGCGPVQAVDERQRVRLHQEPGVQRCPPGTPSTPHPHPSTHPTLERESRTIHPDPRRRMGTPPRLGETST